MTAHRLDLVREFLETLPQDHPFRWFWVRVKERLESEWKIARGEAA